MTNKFSASFYLSKDKLFVASTDDDSTFANGFSGYRYSGEKITESDIVYTYAHTDKGCFYLSALTKPQKIIKGGSRRTNSTLFYLTYIIPRDNFKDTPASFIGNTNVFAVYNTVSDMDELDSDDYYQEAAKCFRTGGLLKTGDDPKGYKFYDADVSSADECSESARKIADNVLKILFKEGFDKTVVLPFDNLLNTKIIRYMLTMLPTPVARYVSFSTMYDKPEKAGKFMVVGDDFGGLADGEPGLINYTEECEDSLYLQLIRLNPDLVNEISHHMEDDGYKCPARANIAKSLLDELETLDMPELINDLFKDVISGGSGSDTAYSALIRIISGLVAENRKDLKFTEQTLKYVNKIIKEADDSELPKLVEIVQYYLVLTALSYSHRDGEDDESGKECLTFLKTVINEQFSDYDQAIRYAFARLEGNDEATANLTGYFLSDDIFTHHVESYSNRTIKSLYTDIIRKILVSDNKYVYVLKCRLYEKLLADEAPEERLVWLEDLIMRDISSPYELNETVKTLKSGKCGSYYVLRRKVMKYLFANPDLITIDNYDEMNDLVTALKSKTTKLSGNLYPETNYEIKTQNRINEFGSKYAVINSAYDRFREEIEKSNMINQEYKDLIGK